MRKTVIVLMVLAALLLVLPVGGAVAKPAPKVDICHVNGANTPLVDVVPGLTMYFGQVISVSENALPAHLAHGDAVDGWVAHPTWVLQLFAPDNVVNANCAWVLPG